MTTQLLRQKLERQKGQRSQIEQTLTSVKEALTDNKRSLHRHEQAREIIREVGQKTQEQLQFHISDITSLALEAVFDDPYKLEVEFVQRRNKTECDLYFVRGDERIDPISASGGGAVDVASFALRIASWSMMRPRTRNTIILDEPFKHLKGHNANLRVLEMLNEVSRKLKTQIIMVSDERIPREDIIANADRVFEVTIHKGKTKIEQL
jgi:DNA repair exonuclease SbcCD ATPase subunit